MDGGETIAADDVLDARGLLCPLPVLKARKRLSRMDTGQVLEIRADDPAAILDVPFFCMETGHVLLAQGGPPEAQHYLIRKA